ncbi:hypothetical protein BOC41_16930 [Burkholderia pseudomallei]|nr:hypothetical protein [Burkholderia pseudomallei]NRE50445.1 hypothetical protein [Burkholderia pseudomallei]OSP94205.1 hypothetical protein BOC41_16930 [Burkholderia pseudomallei]
MLIFVVHIENIWHLKKPPFSPSNKWIWEPPHFFEFAREATFQRHHRNSYRYASA